MYSQTRKKVDNIIVLANYFVAQGDEFLALLRKYRQEVNPDVLFVNVNLSGENAITATDPNKVSFLFFFHSKSNHNIQHPNDIFIAGFSDAILRYIAERGDG